MNDTQFTWNLPFFLSIISSVMISLCGIFPLLIIPFETEGQANLKRWLSFSVGTLLADVFTHIYPEALYEMESTNVNQFSISPFLTGILLFFVIEKFLINDGSQKSKIEAYLNLCANILDNFTHGVAIGASFVISINLGVLTTVCIMLHEIPHEIADFVILLRSGFTRWKAAKAQLMTASVCVMGTLFAKMAHHGKIVNYSTSNLLLFSAGGFLYIALCSLLPSFLSEKYKKESLIQILLIAMGIAVTGTINVLQ